MEIYSRLHIMIKYCTVPTVSKKLIKILCIIYSGGICIVQGASNDCDFVIFDTKRWNTIIDIFVKH